MNYLLYIIIFILTIFLFRKNDKKKQNYLSKIPGPKGKLILGNLLEMKGVELHLKFQEWYNQYGNVFKLKMGNVDTIVLTEFSTIRKAFIGNSIPFQSRFQRNSRKKLNNLKSLIMANGDLHSILKSITLSELTAIKIKKIENNFISNEIKSLFKVFDKFADSGKPFIINDYIKQFSMNVILCLTFGLSFPYEKNEKTIKLVNIIVEFFIVSGQPQMIDFNPLLGLFMKNKRYFEIYEIIKKEMVNLIEDYKLNHKDGKLEDNTIIGKLLQEYNKGNLEWESVLSTSIDLLIAGTDTSANTILFSIVELTNNPEIYKKLNNDIIKSILENQDNDDDGATTDICDDEDNVMILPYSKYRSSIPYLSMFIKEAYRKYPGGPLGLPHILTEDVEIEGYTIPAGVQVIQNIYATHRSKKFFQSPDKFIPERFMIQQEQSVDSKPSSESSQSSQPQQQQNLIHFGSGVRDCLGKSLADSEIFTFLSTLVNRYEFINPTSTPLNEIGKFGVAYCCSNFEIILKKRN